MFLRVLKKLLCKHEEDVVCALYFVHLARATYVILIIIHIQIFVWKQGITIFLYLQAFKIYMKSEGINHLMNFFQYSWLSCFTGRQCNKPKPTSREGKRNVEHDWKFHAQTTLLSPRGRPLLHYLESKSSSDELYDALKVVWFQGKSALNHIHGKGIVHNDISPSNIIVVSSEPLKLCLIDFGIACPIGYDLPFYCGTKSYSHNDLLKKYPNGCTTRIEYDKYSL